MTSHLFIRGRFSIFVYSTLNTHNMKRIITVLTVAFCTLMLAVSCGSKKTPVDELFSLIDENTALEQKYDDGKLSWEEYQEQSDALEAKAKKFIEDNKDYQLTDADRDKIYELAKASAAEEGHEITPEEEKMVKAMLQQIKTLEDFGELDF